MKATSLRPLFSATSNALTVTGLVTVAGSAKRAKSLSLAVLSLCTASGAYCGSVTAVTAAASNMKRCSSAIGRACGNRVSIRGARLDWFISNLISF